MQDRAILTVALAHHARYLRLSRQLLADDLAGWRWILVDNSPDQALRGLANELGFEWLQGPPFPASAPGVPPHAVGSIHHAQGLACGLERVQARYLLILDPDFLLVPADALSRLTREIEERQLFALGAPWTPELHYKWRDAPCLHCLLLDLEHVPRSALHFEPDAVVRPEEPVQRYSALARSLGSIRRLLSPVHQLTTGRIGIGHSRDTGYQVARWLLAHGAGRVGLLPAAVVGRERFEHPWHMRFAWGWWLEKRLPARWSYLPSDDHYRLVDANTSAAELGRLGIDVFLLQDSVLGVHVRHSRSQFGNPADELAFIDRLAAALKKVRS
jgi:hypothetical protein